MKLRLFTILIMLTLPMMLIETIGNQTTAIVAAEMTTGATTRVSVASDGTQGDSASWNSSISADGRYVAFYSSASSLVSSDTNNTDDIFVHDRQMGQTQRISVASDGTQGNGSSSRPSISADGRYVAFMSGASNLVSGDTNNTADIFVHDWQMGQTQRISVASDGTQANNGSWYPSISANGDYVAFQSYASNLVNGDTNNSWDVFIYNRQMGQTSRISVASDGTQGNSRSEHSSISADGRYVAFGSLASNLVPGDTNGAWDVFVYDRQEGQTQRVSVASDGTQGNNGSGSHSISADGRYVAFRSSASNLIDSDTNGYEDIFVHDRQMGETQRVSLASGGTQGNNASQYPSISTDGRYVTFHSLASNLVGGDTNGYRDVFVHDRQMGETQRISVSSGGIQGNNASALPSTSADGRYVAFHSNASNLVADDTNNAWDIFVRDREASDAFSLSGRITDANNNPVVGVAVSTSTGHSATTNANGDYTIIGLSADTYTLIPSKTGYTFSPSSRTLSVSFDKSGQDFVANSLSQECSVPFFWQRDDRWKNHPLRTNGSCSAFCSTIGACGCTLTSSTMVFAYYGASLTPPTLSDCMGTTACPFNYGNGVSCTGGQATFRGRYAFSWSRLEQELNQNNRPVLLGMHRKGNRNDTHWVVVLSGNGSNPSNYRIHDPLFVGGNDLSLSTRWQDYDFDWLVVYGGQPACLSSLNSGMNEDHALNSELRSFSSARRSAMAFQPEVDFVGASSSSTISGTVLIYRLNEATMTVQLIADSSEGNITEMQLWTDSEPVAEWQPLATLISLPLSDTVYVRFRDEVGNESMTYSDSIYPQYSPPLDLLNVFLPAILKGQ